LRVAGPLRVPFTRPLLVVRAFVAGLFRCEVFVLPAVPFRDFVAARLRVAAIVFVLLPAVLAPAAAGLGD
jgi:hypothetical protein